MQQKKFLRAERVADAIHKELAGIIVKFCQDPRLDKLTITNVKLSQDLSVAKIYFTDFSKDILHENLKTDSIKKVLKILSHANTFLRSQLAHRMSLRKVPELKFFYDENASHGMKMDELFAKIGVISSKNFNENNKNKD